MSIDPNAMRRAYLIGDARRICKELKIEEPDWELMLSAEIEFFIQRHKGECLKNDDNHDEKHAYER